MKVYEIITENPYKGLVNLIGKAMGNKSMGKDPRREQIRHYIGDLGDEAKSELEAAKDWYKKLKDKPKEFSQTILDKDGKPLDRNLTDAEILALWKQQVNKPNTNASVRDQPTPPPSPPNNFPAQKVRDKTADTVRAYLNKTAPTSALNFVTKSVLRIFGNIIGNGVMTVLTATNMVWAFQIYFSFKRKADKALAEQGTYLGVQIKTEDDRDYVLGDARQELYLVLAGQAALYGVYFLHVWILFFTKGRVNVLSSLLTKPLAYGSLQFLMATPPMNEYITGLFNYLINNNQSEVNKMTKSWDDESIINMIKEKTPELYNWLKSQGVFN